MNLKPNMYKKDIYSIDYNKLLDKKYLFFDLDNTIMSYQDNTPDKKAIELFKKLNKMGFKCFIFSNSYSKRVMKVKDILDIDVYGNSMKPLKKNYKKVINKYDKNKCVFIGDQIMTDILGAKRNDLFVILVDRINNKEPIWTKFWRFFEWFILKIYEKEDTLVKGKYYD